MSLTCAFGAPWGSRGCGPCKKCQAATTRAIAAFWRGVFFGEWDADGYSPAERRMQAKRA